MDNIDQTLADLQQKVSHFAVNTNAKSTFIFPNINKNTLMYCLIPIIIFSILLLWKPKFLTQEIKKEGSLPTQKINILKLLVTTLIMSGIIILALFLVFKNIPK